jgi:tetratricopeptide (TPR) repeat protein
MNNHRTILSAGLVAMSVMSGAELSAQGIAVPGVAPTARPAWVSGDIPSDVWQRVEAAVTANDEDRRQLLVEAEHHARTRIAERPESADRRFALAVVLGMRADREGGRTKIRAASALHDQLSAILVDEPDHAGARYLLGRLHAGVRRMNRVTRWLATNLLGGETLKQATWAGAEEHLTFAEQSAPEVPDHHLQLARLYEDTGRPERAREELEHVLELEPRSALEREAHASALQRAAALGLR